MREHKAFNNIFEVSPVPTCILEGRFPHIFISEANAAYIKLTGRNRNDILETPFFITNPHSGMYLDQHSFKDVEQSIEKVYLEKSTVKTPVQKFLKPIHQGQEFETLYLEATNTPVLKPGGEIDYIVRTLQNVTDIMRVAEKEKEKDQQLIENEQFLRETQKVAKIGSWEMDKYGHFKWADIHYEIMVPKLHSNWAIHY